jgi:hypothetical protein
MMTNNLSQGHAFIFVLGLGALIGACGGQQKAASSAADGPKANAAQAADAEPFDFDAALAREATGLTERTVQGPDSAWSVKVPASAQPQVEPIEQVVVVEVPIGPESAVRCQVFPETVDAAGTLHGVLKESSSRVEYRTVAPSGVRLFAGMPATSINALYLADVTGGKAAGGLQLAIHTSEERSMLCILDELGYRKTFEHVSSAFFSTFRTKSPFKSLATYLEVSKTSLDDTDVGFSISRMLPGEKPGERIYTSIGATFMPSSPKDVAFEDSYTVLKLNVKGQLQEGTWVEGSAGEITMQMTLTRAPDGKYTYDGTISGKPLQGALVTPKGIYTSLDVAALLKKKLKAGKPFTETVAEYHPSIDPLATVDVSYTHAEGTPARQVVVRLGERAFTADVDDDGMPKDGWFDLGKRKLIFKRERVDGRL